jgi:hypothetical protein
MATTNRMYHMPQLKPGSFRFGTLEGRVSEESELLDMVWSYE